MKLIDFHISKPWKDSDLVAKALVLALDAFRSIILMHDIKSIHRTSAKAIRQIEILLGEDE